MPVKTRITIKDVAREAGCGVATASRVLNQSGPASEETRARVQQVAHDLGFAFNATGRALQSRKSMTVGCLVPSLANPVFAEAVQGVQEALLGSGYQLLISTSNYNGVVDDESLKVLLGKDVDGLIVTMAAPEHSTALAMARKNGVPVWLMFHNPVAGLCSAYVDNIEAAHEVARQFALKGHKQAGFLALRFSSSDRSRLRYAGFVAGCRQQGLAEPTLIELTERDAHNPDTLAAILAAHDRLTAIFASNDFLAIAVQKAARALGWQVPRDLSVAGFDGIDIGRLLDVPLATIETTPEAMGRQAAQSLLTAMQGGAPEQAPALPFTFRAGGTLGPPGPERTGRAPRDRET